MGGLSCRTRKAEKFHLELLNGFERQLGAAGAYEFIIVVETVDGHIVAAPSKTAEREATVGHRCERPPARLLRRTGHTWSQQYEIQIIAALDRQFFDAFLIDRRTD